jgi:NAD-dependent DNA ligase
MICHETDGVVVKVNHFQYQDELGYTAKCDANGIQVQIRAKPS